MKKQSSSNSAQTPPESQEETCSESKLGSIPTAEEIEAWAEAEHKRRQAWLAGPTDEEKLEWARMERYRRWTRAAMEAGAIEKEDIALLLASRRLRKQGQLLRKGTLSELAAFPFEILERVLRLDLEEETGLSSGRQGRRIPFSEDDF